jgi:hypothetical protein
MESAQARLSGICVREATFLGPTSDFHSSGKMILQAPHDTHDTHDKHAKHDTSAHDTEVWQVVAGGGATGEEKKRTVPGRW